MPLRRLATTAVLALALTGCVSLPGTADRPASPTAATTYQLDPAGPAAPSALPTWPTPTQPPGRQALATTAPEAPKTSPKATKGPNRSTTRRGRAAAPAAGTHRPAPPRTWAPRPRPAIKPAAPKRRPAAVPRRQQPKGAPSMRQLCRQSNGVTSAELTQLCRSTYGR